MPPFTLLDANGWIRLIREVVQNRVAVRQREDIENEVWAELLRCASAQRRVRSARGFVASVVHTQVRLWRKHERRECAGHAERLDQEPARAEAPLPESASPRLPPLRGRRRVALRDGVLEQRSATELAAAWNQQVREVHRQMNDLAKLLFRWHRAE